MLLFAAGLGGKQPLRGWAGLGGQFRSRGMPGGLGAFRERQRQPPAPSPSLLIPL